MCLHVRTAVFKLPGCIHVYLYVYIPVYGVCFPSDSALLWPPGMTATVVTYPLDVLNTRMAVTKHKLSYSQVKNDHRLPLYCLSSP